VPTWGWVLLFGYLSLLLGAALWAIAERARAAIMQREPDAVFDLAATDSMTTREADAESEAAEALLGRTA
jgi:hypothetical protein